MKTEDRNTEVNTDDRKTMGKLTEREIDTVTDKQKTESQPDIKTDKQKDIWT
jgi:hypothetical protein